MAAIEGVWAIVTSYGRQYIGRLCDFTDKSGVEDTLDKNTECFLHLNPVFDYVVHTQLQQNNAMKIPILTPFDMANGECSTHVKLTGITFFEEMQKFDRERYEKMVGQAMDEVMRARLKNESGIELVSSIPTRRG